MEKRIKICIKCGETDQSQFWDTSTLCKECLKEQRVNKEEYFTKEDVREANNEFLIKIGWKYNPINKKWYNDVLRDKNGKWLEPYRTVIRKAPKAEKINDKTIDNIEDVPYIEYSDRNTDHLSIKVTREIQYEYFISGVPQKILIDAYSEYDPMKIKYVITRTLLLLNNY